MNIVIELQARKHTRLAEITTLDILRAVTVVVQSTSRTKGLFRNTVRHHFVYSSPEHPEHKHKNQRKTHTKGKLPCIQICAHESACIHINAVHQKPNQFLICIRHLLPLLTCSELERLPEWYEGTTAIRLICSKHAHHIRNPEKLDRMAWKDPILKAPKKYVKWKKIFQAPRFGSDRRAIPWMRQFVIAFTPKRSIAGKKNLSSDFQNTDFQKHTKISMCVPNKNVKNLSEAVAYHPRLSWPAQQRGSRLKCR